MLAAKLGELTEALAGNLELHLKTLDLNDENARKEHAAYLKLAEEHRQIGVQLQAIGQEMAGHRDLAMGRHDQRAMSSPELAEAFEKFVKPNRSSVRCSRPGWNRIRECSPRCAEARDGRTPGGRVADAMLVGVS